jgi:hypothetical protein
VADASQQKAFAGQHVGHAGQQVTDASQQKAFADQQDPNDGRQVSGPVDQPEGAAYKGLPQNDMRARFSCLIVLSGCLACVSAFALAANSFSTFDDVDQVLRFFVGKLPVELIPPESRQKFWPDWIVRHDREIRGRLLPGDEDTIVNWLMFGTSFTKEPKALFEVSETSHDLPKVISRRITDFIAGLRSANPDERSIFARQVLQSQGYGFDTAPERSHLERRLHEEVDRVLAERQQYARREESFRRGDFSEQMIVQSHLFRDRGLSLDTSILPSFALDQALETMTSQKLLTANSIRRVAVIGPGLDFADKNSGNDFYPIQTLQPFSSMDSLQRLGLAGPAGLELTTFDISPRVNDHILKMRHQGEKGVPYVLRLPLEPGAPWSPSLIDYWKHLGDRIGVEIHEKKPSSIKKGMEIRTIQVRPQVMAEVRPEDFNVVTQRWTGPPFDLVIATNVFVYYDEFDQSLAFAGIESMLRPGGFFLTNNAIVELPTSRLRSMGLATIRHSVEISDHIFWYCRIL